MLLQVFKDTIQLYGKHNGGRMAAALAYRTIFALSPLLIIIVGIGTYIFGITDTLNNFDVNGVYEQIETATSPQVAEAISAFLPNPSAQGASALATIVGFSVLLFAASGMFNELVSSLDTIWLDVIEAEPEQAAYEPIKRFLTRRLKAFSLVLGTGLALIFAVAYSGLVAQLRPILPAWVPSFRTDTYLINLLLNAIIFATIFAALYKFLPHVSLEWRDVIPAGFLAAGLFILGKIIIGEYLVRGGVASAFGAAGSLIIILVWVYYSAQIFLLGAAFSRAYAEGFGSKKS